MKPDKDFVHAPPGPDSKLSKITSMRRFIPIDLGMKRPEHGQTLREVTALSSFTYMIAYR
jgi:hypothetical protein